MEKNDCLDKWGLGKLKINKPSTNYLYLNLNLSNGYNKGNYKLYHSEI